MNLNPVELLDPVFNFLAALIQNYGLIFTWCLSGWLPVIAWIFSGGLRRKRPQGNSAAVPPRHHHHDATDEPTNTANYQHRG